MACSSRMKRTVPTIAHEREMLVNEMLKASLKCNCWQIRRLKRSSFDSFVRFKGPRFKQYNRQQRDFQGKEKTSLQL